MTPVAFIDANVPIYAAGRDHSNKAPCTQVLALVVERPSLFVTDAEVLQELMHLYLSRRWALGREVLQGFADLMQGRIEPIYGEDTLVAARLAGGHTGISARDLLHAAVMHRIGTDRIVTADADFDRLPGLTRLDPARIGEWGDSVLERVSG